MSRVRLRSNVPAVFFATALAVAALAGAPAPVRAELKLESLTPALREKLWKEVRAAAFREVILRYCGKPSGIEVKIRAAVAPCVEKASLDAVERRFQSEIRTQSKETVRFRPKSDLCTDREVNEVLDKVEARFAKLVRDATAACRACTTCRGEPPAAGSFSGRK